MLRASSFGSKCELPDPFLKKVANCGVVDSILSFASFKADRELKKGDGAKRHRLTGACVCVCVCVCVCQRCGPVVLGSLAAAGTAQKIVHACLAVVRRPQCW
jgi:hypothetical protein